MKEVIILSVISQMIAIGFNEPLDSPYPNCEVFGFRPGSVIANYQMLMNPETRSNEEDIEKEIEDAFENNNGTIEGITPEDGSLTVIRKSLK